MDKSVFVFYIASEKYNTRSGGRKLEIVVHGIKNNLPNYCGNFVVSTASYKGEVSEVMNHLGRNGYIDSSFADGYYKENDSFQIVRI